MAVPAKHKGKMITGRKSSRRRCASSSSGRSLGVLYWMVFLIGVAAWGVLFGREFAKFDLYADRVEKQVISLSNVVLTKKEVLGTEDTEPTEEGADSTEPADEPISDESIAQVVDEIEEERKEKIRDMLSLELPSETDNPNFPVTFVEPTEEGVEIQVDGEGFSKKKSPFALPSLPIGQHTLNFKFLDEDEVTQNLEEKLIIIPRAPSWDGDIPTQVDGSSEIVLSGTATPRSTVIVLVSSELFTVETESDKEGNWEAVLTENLSSGKHTALSIVRKDGYASNFSEPFEFTVGNVEGAADSYDEIEEVPVSSDSASMLFGGFVDINEDNYVLILGWVGVAALVLLILVALLSKLFSGPADPDEKWIEDIKENGKPSKGLSLREKFAQAGLNVHDKKDEAGKQCDETEESASEPEEESDGIYTDEVDKEVQEKKEEKKEEKEVNSDEDMDRTGMDEHAEKDQDPSPDASDEVETEASENTVLPVKEINEQNEKAAPKPGKVYSKDEFMKTFKEPTTMGKETKKIRISLTSQSGK